MTVKFSINNQSYWYVQSGAWNEEWNFDGPSLILAQKIYYIHVKLFAYTKQVTISNWAMQYWVKL